MAFPMSLGVTPNLTGLKEQHSLFPLVVLGCSLSGLPLQLYIEGAGAGGIVGRSPLTRPTVGQGFLTMWLLGS